MGGNRPDDPKVLWLRQRSEYLREPNSLTDINHGLENQIVRQERMPFTSLERFRVVDSPRLDDPGRWKSHTTIRP
jgi:hypothetical protein